MSIRRERRKDVGLAFDRPDGHWRPDAARPDATRPDATRGAARHAPPGVIDPEAVSDDVRSVVMYLTSRVDDLTGALDQARRRVAELETAADEDTLLPVLNRRGFVRELSRTIAFTSRYATDASVIVLDVSRLRRINEAFGHQAGDAVLKTVAMRLRRSLRASDVIGRLGGDELGAILWSASGEDAARKVAALVAAIAAEPVLFNGLRMDIAVSGGAVQLRPDDSTDTALKRVERSVTGIAMCPPPESAIAHPRDNRGDRAADDAT